MKYSVKFLIKDWVEVTVTDSSQEKAIEQAEKEIDKGYKSKGVTCIDSSTKFAGIDLIDVIDELD